MGVENNKHIKFPVASEALLENGVPRFNDGTTTAVITTPDGQTKTFAFLEDLQPSEGGQIPLFVTGEQPTRIGNTATELLYQTQHDFIGLELFIQGKNATNNVDYLITGADTFKIIFPGLLGNLPDGPEDRGYAFKVNYRYVVV